MIQSGCDSMSDSSINKKLKILADFYNSKRWRNKRKYILARDSHLCKECRKYGRSTQASTVHHITPLEEFADRLIKGSIDIAEFFRLALEDSNLESLCDSCHNKKHPEKGGKRF